jgi:hypothetical protein
MADYSAPVWDIKFVLEELANIEHVGSYNDFDEFDIAMVQPVLEEAARFI